MFYCPSTGERKPKKKAPFGSDEKVGQNRKHFVGNHFQVKLNKLGKKITSSTFATNTGNKKKFGLKQKKKPRCVSGSSSAPTLKGRTLARLDARWFSASSKRLGNI